MENFTFTGGSFVYVSEITRNFSYSPKNPKTYDSERFTDTMLESLYNKDYYEKGYFFTDEPELTDVNDFVKIDWLPKLPVWDEIDKILSERDMAHIREMDKGVKELTETEIANAQELEYCMDYVVQGFENYIVKEACPFNTIKEHIDEVRIVFNEKENAFLSVAETDYDLQEIWNNYILTNDFKKLTEEAKEQLDAYLEETKEDKEMEGEER